MINLIKLAEELESPDHEALVASENDPEVLEVVAMALVKAANALRDAASVVEVAKKPLLTEQSLDEMAAVAASFAESGDALLEKQASVIDDFLYVLASPAAKQLLKNSDNKATDKEKMEAHIDALKGQYTDYFQESIAVKRAVEEIKNGPAYQTNYRPLEQPLSSRSCPDHPGVPLHRVAEGEFQCDLDKKIYSWNDGFETIKGNKVPGINVSEQNVYDTPTMGSVVNDSRLGRMGKI